MLYEGSQGFSVQSNRVQCDRSWLLLESDCHKEDLSEDEDNIAIDMEGDESGEKETEKERADSYRYQAEEEDIPIYHQDVSEMASSLHSWQQKEGTSCSVSSFHTTAFNDEHRDGQLGGIQRLGSVYSESFCSIPTRGVCHEDQVKTRMMNNPYERRMTVVERTSGQSLYDPGEFSTLGTRSRSSTFPLHFRDQKLKLDQPGQEKGYWNGPNRVLGSLEESILHSEAESLEEMEEEPEDTSNYSNSFQVVNHHESRSRVRFVQGSVVREQATSKERERKEDRNEYPMMTCQRSTSFFAFPFFLAPIWWTDYLSLCKTVNLWME